jgi:UDP-N-acetylmuramoyl-tripeptide--D-alanyl-D-alanine ligase
MATPIPRNHAGFTVAEILRETGGVLAVPGAERVLAISTDTRAIEPGDGFVALRGEVHDGHAHLHAAAARGAVLALVDRDVDAPPMGLCIVRVPDTLVALGDLARAHRRRWCRPGQRRSVIAITGSAGKTTTRIAVAAALSHVVPGGAAVVHGSRGNLNNRVGVPMVLLGLEREHVVAVVEMGMNQPGEIAELCRIAEPDIGIVTLIAAAHTEGLGSIEAVAYEKGALFRALSAEGIAIGNADDPRVRAEIARSPARRRYLYGRAADADVRILSREPVGMHASRVQVMGHAFTTPLLGEAGALACAAAVTVVDHGMDGGRGEGYEGAFAELTPGDGAGRLVPRLLPGDVAVIDDTYNANPASTCSSIRAAAEIASVTGRRLLLLLGEMKELGALSDAGHDEVGRAAGESGAAEVFAVGAGSSPRIAVRAAERGVRASHAERVEDATALLRLAARPGDLVLIKGSRSIGTERVVASLARDLDCGQGSPR